MPSAKTAVGLVLIIASASFALLVFLNNSGAAIPGISGLARNAPLNSQPSANPKGSSSENSTPAVIREEDDGTAEGNLTKIFASQMALDFQSKNPNGPDTSKGAGSYTMPGNVDLNKILAQNSAETDWKKVVPAITDKDIKILSASSRADALNYLNLMKEALAVAGTSSGISMDKNATIEDLAKSSVLTLEKLNTAIKNVKSVAVPLVFKGFHEKVLTILAGEKISFEKFASAKQDPLAAIIAVKWIEGVKDETLTIGIDLDKILKDNNFFKQ